jgi:hypothetical protein
MTKENQIYVRSEPRESILTKKNILSSELNLINILKIIKRYKYLKEEETILKIKAYKLIKETGTLIRKTRTILPLIKVPEKQKLEEIKENENKKLKEKEDKDLELQLKEIQNKLKELESDYNNF